MWGKVLFNVIIPALMSVLDWFNKLFDAVPGSLNFYISIFFVICSFRFLLAPLFSGAKAGSDRAKHTKNDSSSKRQSDNMEG